MYRLGVSMTDEDFEGMIAKGVVSGINGFLSSIFRSCILLIVGFYILIVIINSVL
jgi:hypothetical protein